MDSDLLVHLCELKYIKYYILYFNDYIKKFWHIKILIIFNKNCYHLFYLVSDENIIFSFLLL